MSKRIRGIIDAITDIAAQPGDGLLDKINAYHGSPHDFDRFSTDNIGTGAGVQAYGHGLYFAESEGTAKSYRDSLSYNYRHRDTSLKEAGIDENLSDESLHSFSAALFDAKYKSHSQIADNIQMMSKEFRSIPKEKIIDAVSRYQDKVRGRMYEVNIDARPEELIDFDAPLSEQSDKVKKVWEEWQASAAGKRVANEMPGNFKGDITGQEMHGLIYEGMIPDPNQKYGRGLVVKEAADTANYLKDRGLKGIMYDDPMSRHSATRELTKNYVIFDDKLVQIARKYGVSLPVAGAILAGTISPQQAQASTANNRNSKGLLDLLGGAALEAISGVNRGLIDSANFLTVDQINAILNLSGSDRRVPDLYDIPGIESGTIGNYMEPGLPRQIIRQGSEFLSPI